MFSLRSSCAWGNQQMESCGKQHFHTIDLKMYHGQLRLEINPQSSEFLLRKKIWKENDNESIRRFFFAATTKRSTVYVRLRNDTSNLWETNWDLSYCLLFLVFSSRLAAGWGFRQRKKLFLFWEMRQCCRRICFRDFWEGAQRSTLSRLLKFRLWVAIGPQTVQREVLGNRRLCFIVNHSSN